MRIEASVHVTHDLTTELNQHHKLETTCLHLSFPVDVAVKADVTDGEGQQKQQKRAVLSHSGYPPPRPNKLKLEFYGQALRYPLGEALDLSHDQDPRGQLSKLE